jgi:DNA-binding MurR/RpiR family transcriptional regulator
VAIELEARAPQGLVNLVQERMSTLTSAERKVARVFLASYPIAGLETVAQLASRAGASGPTVMRFVNKLGFDGYPAFRDALRLEVQEKLTSSLAQYPESEARPSGGVIEESLKVFHAELDQSFADLSRSEFEAVVDLLADARYAVWCTGGRFSQVFAFFLFAHLNMMRSRCRHIVAAPTPGWDELIDADKKTVLVVFDYRRYQNSTIEFARRAAEMGCRIVLFTDPWLSPVASVARHVLTCTVRGPSPFDTMVPGLALIETVVAELSVRLGAQAKPRITELERLRAGTTWGEIVMETD